MHSIKAVTKDLIVLPLRSPSSRSYHRVNRRPETPPIAHLGQPSLSDGHHTACFAASIESLG